MLNCSDIRVQSNLSASDTLEFRSRKRSYEIANDDKLIASTCKTPLVHRLTLGYCVTYKPTRR